MSDVEGIRNGPALFTSRRISTSRSTFIAKNLVVLTSRLGLFGYLPCLSPPFSPIRCRLDRASSPPRALKLVAAAAAEVREALAGLADSLEGDKCVGDKITSGAHSKGPNDEGGAGGRDTCGDESGPKESTTGLQSAISTLADIVSNCHFLLKCTTHLPSIDLGR